jgi:hypothetical protein
VHLEEAAVALVNPEFQVITEVSGWLIIRQSAYHMSADSLLAARRFSPFAEFIFVGRKVTQEIDD